jgi:hypothetical protein
MKGACMKYRVYIIMTAFLIVLTVCSGYIAVKKYFIVKKENSLLLKYPLETTSINFSQEGGYVEEYRQYIPCQFGGFLCIDVDLPSDQIEKLIINELECEITIKTRGDSIIYREGFGDNRQGEYAQIHLDSGRDILCLRLKDLSYPAGNYKFFIDIERGVSAFASLPQKVHIEYDPSVLNMKPKISLIDMVLHFVLFVILIIIETVILRRYKKALSNT